MPTHDYYHGNNEAYIDETKEEIDMTAKSEYVRDLAFLDSLQEHGQEAIESPYWGANVQTHVLLFTIIRTLVYIAKTLLLFNYNAQKGEK